MNISNNNYCSDYQISVSVRHVLWKQRSTGTCSSFITCIAEQVKSISVSRLTGLISSLIAKSALSGKIVSRGRTECAKK